MEHSSRSNSLSFSPPPPPSPASSYDPTSSQNPSSSKPVLHHQSTNLQTGRSRYTVQRELDDMRSLLRNVLQLQHETTKHLLYLTRTIDTMAQTISLQIDQTTLRQKELSNEVEECRNLVLKSYNDIEKMLVKTVRKTTCKTFPGISRGFTQKKYKT